VVLPQRVQLAGGDLVGLEQMKQSVGSLRQKALDLGIGLGHQR
jgi:hypothetical protein